MTRFNITEGWVAWLHSSPHTYIGGDAYPVEIMRPEWDKSRVIYAKDMNPEMNVAGLYWRATGIYRNFVSEVRPAYQQANRYGAGWESCLAGMLGGTAYSGPANCYFWPDGSVSGRPR